MNQKKTRVKVNLTRRDVLTVGAAAVGSAVAAQFLTTGPLSPFAGLKQDMLAAKAATGEISLGHGDQPGPLHRLRILPARLQRRQ
jgi:hypothetical protein